MRKPVLANCSHSQRTVIAFSPTRRALVAGRLFVTALPNHTKPITMPTSAVVSERGRKHRQTRRPKPCAVLNYELKKHLYRDSPEVGKDRNSVDGKDLIPRGTVCGSREDSRARRANRIRKSRWRTGSRGP